MTTWFRNCIAREMFSNKTRNMMFLCISLLCSYILRNISKHNVRNEITNALKVPMPTLQIANEESNTTSIYGQNSDKYWMVSFICKLYLQRGDVYERNMSCFTDIILICKFIFKKLN